MKRKAPYDLDRRELEQNGYDIPEDEGQQNEQQQATDVSQRRIVKLRNPSEVYASKAENGSAPVIGKFNLAGNLESNTNGTEQKGEATPSFLSSASAKTGGSLFSNTHLHTEAAKPIPTSAMWQNNNTSLSAGAITSSLFTNNAAKPAAVEEKQPEKPAEPVVEKKVEEKKPEPEAKPAGIFSNLTTNTNLFSNTATTGSIFDNKAGSLFSNANQTGLFGNLFPKTDEAKPAENGAKGGGLFGNLLGGNAADSAGLFSSYLSNNNRTFDDLLKNSTGNNMFSGAAKAGSDDEGDGGDDDDEPQRSDSPEIDQSKIERTYEYEEHFEKVISKPVDKFKVNDNANTMNGTLALEKSKENNTHTVVFRDTSKVIRYQGMIFKGVSRAKHIFDNKPHTLSIVCYSVKKAGEGEAKEAAKEGDKPPAGFLAKFNCDVIKLMFPRPEDCLEVKAAVEKALQ